MLLLKALEQLLLMGFLPLLVHFSYFFEDNLSFSYPNIPIFSAGVYVVAGDAGFGATGNIFTSSIVPSVAGNFSAGFKDTEK